MLETWVCTDQSLPPPSTVSIQTFLGKNICLSLTLPEDTEAIYKQELLVLQLKCSQFWRWAVAVTHTMQPFRSRSKEYSGIFNGTGWLKPSFGMPQHHAVTIILILNWGGTATVLIQKPPSIKTVSCSTQVTMEISHPHTDPAQPCLALVNRIQAG